MKVKHLKYIILALAFAGLFMPAIIFGDVHSPGIAQWMYTRFIFPFIVPKILYIRTVILLMLGAWVLLQFSENTLDKKFWKTPMTITVVAFFVSFFISTFVGVDAYKSFWDNHERMLGLFTMVHFGFFYLILTSTITKDIHWKYLFRFFAIIGLLITLVGIRQKYLDINYLFNNGSPRVYATLGNAIYLGGLGLYMYFQGIMLFFKEKDTYWKAFAVLTVLAGILNIFLSGTRGTLLGLIAGTIVLVLLTLFFTKNKTYHKYGAGLVVLGIIGAGLLFAFRATPTVQNIPAIGRLVNTSLTGGTANTRIMAWTIAVEGWKEKPVFGWGPNNFFVAFNKYYNPAFLEHGIGETWFDSAHNAMFNTLAIQGIIGLLLYIALFIVPMMYGYKVMKKRPEEKILWIIISAFLVGHFIHNFFVFENPTSYLYFFLLYAYVNRVWFLKLSDEVSTNESKKIPLVGGVIVVLAVLMIFNVTNLQPAKANIVSNKANVLLARQGNIRFVDEALTTPSPHIDDIRFNLSQSAVDALQLLAQKNDVEKAKEVFILAHGLLVQNIELHPLDVRYYMAKSRLEQIAYELFKDPQYLEQAEQTMLAARELSPKRQQLVYVLSVIQFQLGKSDASEALLSQTISENEKIAESWIRLALIYRDTNRTSLAVETVEKMKNIEGLKYTGAARQLLQLFENSLATTTPELAE